MTQFNHTITVTATLTLTEAELGALDALAGYGADRFLKVFYEKLGEHYMKPHEKGLRSLFDTISNTVPEPLRNVRRARQALAKREDAGDLSADLLEALKQSEGAVEELCTGQDPANQCWFTLADIRAAIAKAEGGAA